MPEKFLVVGPTSFYGRNFVKLLEEKGHCVSTLSLRNWNDAQVGHPDYVVNFAAANIVSESWQRPIEYVSVNVSYLVELLEVLSKRNIKKFVQASTPEVYGSVDAWVKEDQPFNPSTPYAVSKASADMMLMAYQRAYGLPVVLTRTANIYGPNQPENRIVTKALRCKRKGEKLRLEGAGCSVRCFIHVRDACEATYLAATKGKPGEVYHISGREPLRIRELVEKIGCEWVQTPDRMAKDYAYLLDSTKIRKLGWRDRINLEEGLKECESSISA